MATAQRSRDDMQAFDALLNPGPLVTGGRVAANWLPGGSFWYVDGAPGSKTIKKLDPATDKITEMFDVVKVREALARLIDRPLPYAGLPFETFVQTGDAVIFGFEGVSYRLDTTDYSIAAMPLPNLIEMLWGCSAQSLASPRTFLRPSYYVETFPVPEMPSPDGRRMIGIQNYNLSIHYAEDGRNEQLTEDGERYYGWDVESVRMGAAAGGSIARRTTNPWSPDGLNLFATKVDQRRVPIWFTTHLLKRHHELSEARVARAGDPLPIVEPYVVDVLEHKAVRIALATENKFLLFLGWKADGRSLYLMLFSRDMAEASLYMADARTGESRLIYCERGQSFIRIQHQIIAGRTGCAVLANDSGFIWESEADGWNHLYLHDREGKRVRQLTSGKWPVLDVLAVDPGAGMVHFLAHHDAKRPYDVHLCKVPLAGGEVQRLTPEEGVHEIQLAPDFSSFVATRSTPDLPPRSEVRRADGKLVREFPPADISKLQRLGWAAPEQFSVKAADGATDLWGILYKPPQFDAKQRYPVIEYIYGGPQIVYTPHHFYIAPDNTIMAIGGALARQGYVVVMLDARGTPERSKAFHDVTFKEWRRHVTDDHACALRNLAANRPWMDMERVGVYGHSWGGYFTIACLLDQPEVYRAGVASAPGTDPHDYFIYEPYLGGPPSPDNNPAYRGAVLYDDAAKLKGALMIVAGTADVAPWQDAIKMTHALINAGKDHEFVVLPEEGHGYRACPDKYVARKILSHFDRHLRS